jgi:hypothetical protein
MHESHEGGPWQLNYPGDERTIVSFGFLSGNIDDDKLCGGDLAPQQQEDGWAHGLRDILYHTQRGVCQDLSPVIQMRVVDKRLADSLEKNLGLRFDVLRPEAGATLQRAHESVYCFASSPRRPYFEDKRMVLEHTHGLFIT